MHKGGTVLVSNRRLGGYMIFPDLDRAISGLSSARAFYEGVPFCDGECARLRTFEQYGKALKNGLRTGAQAAHIVALLDDMLDQVEGSVDDRKALAENLLNVLSRMIERGAGDSAQAQHYLEAARLQVHNRALIVDKGILPGLYERTLQMSRYRTWCDLVVFSLLEQIRVLMAHPLLTTSPNGERPSNWSVYMELRRSVQHLREWLEGLVLPRPYFKHIRRVAAELKMVGAHLQNLAFESARDALSASSSGLQLLRLRRNMESMRDILRAEVNQPTMRQILTRLITEVVAIPGPTRELLNVNSCVLALLEGQEHGLGTTSRSATLRDALRDLQSYL
ncbi:hypothetical protein COV06_02460 [Candidatus Uhrbacteria bacterium CG10_big_fil_rev_8_21_14_0_10_50_16]|uniref:Uncharacterized protein n=1 Tax=Candidatus Uhrbacteria bacterium CG10_big_fil_rev_8_21_14_0_10_50_16 TaxID=1975039 RepID=A0A2H0RNS8_9BACT|nr:MAG: hypothetical protein COV06_02460 [Candidatus Uhrbacteria bacterium CG10_big_fil_rev_8_21_14_0_10_50_16]